MTTKPNQTLCEIFMSEKNPTAVALGRLGGAETKGERMRQIPTVKTWRITTANGDRFEILAPTRRLALLNFRHEGYWQDIRTIGLVRQSPDSPCPECARSHGPHYRGSCNH